MDWNQRMADICMVIAVILAVIYVIHGVYTSNHTQKAEITIEVTE